MRLIRSILICLASAAPALSCGEPAGPATGRAEMLERVRGFSQVGVAGEALDTALVVLVRDGAGTPIPGVEVSFSVVSGGGAITPREVRTDQTGMATAEWVLGGLVRTDQVVVASVARAGGAPLQAVFTAQAQATGPIAEITSVEPALLTPGATLIVTGVGLEYVVAVTVAGVSAEIREQTSTTLSAELPVAGFGCAPTAGVPVLLIADGGNVVHLSPLRTAPERALAPGQVLVGSIADPLTCFELPAGTGRYAVAVASTSPDTASKPGLRVRAIAPEPQLPSGLVTQPAIGAQQARSAAVSLRDGSAGAHGAVLAANAAQLRSPASALPYRSVNTAPDAGDTVMVRVPRLNGVPGPALCTAYDSVRARVVRVGEHGVVAEDIANPLAGQMDELLAGVAEEFDARQYDIVRSNFGDPVRNGGGVLMLFSRLVNSYGVSGFVWAGDAAPRAACPQSNEAAVFYGYVPTVDGSGYGEGTRREWLWTIRPTIVHEVKHLASLARQPSGTTAAEPWLEEATAMVAEEIWARAVFGYGRRGNVEFDESVGCEIDGAFERGPCAGRPSAMFAHFLLLARWMRDPGAHSMLGPAAPDDFSYYGSAWLFLRWLLDTSDRAEVDVLREITDSQLGSVATLEAAFGQPFGTLLPQWAAAVLVDERLPGSQVSGWTIPSWDLRSIYSGLNREQPVLFPTAFPLRVHTLTAAGSAVEVPVVRGGGAAFFELSGTPAGPQALAFEGAGGGALPPYLRIVIVRLD